MRECNCGTENFKLVQRQEYSDSKLPTYKAVSLWGAELGPKLNDSTEWKMVSKIPHRLVDKLGKTKYVTVR